MRHAILAAVLLSAPAAARHPAPTVAPSPAELVAMATAPAGATATIRGDERGYLGETMRMALDLRFGPADAVSDGLAVWNATAEGRGTSMLGAGVSRATYRNVDGHAVVTIEGLRGPSTLLAAR